MSYHNSNSSYRDGDRSRHPRDNNNRNLDRRFQSTNRCTLTDKENDLVYQGRDELFDKEKIFSRVPQLQDKSLLSSENLFTNDRWTINELMQLKEKLNNTRNLLNEKDIKVWKQHTTKTNMTGRVVWPLRDYNEIEMCTNAWIKMAEIFSKYKNLIPNLREDQTFRTVHVCEAPGAFICATHFYYNQYYERRNSRSSQHLWDWMGLSLNPYYEGNDQEAMVDDDRFIVETLDKWYFGEDNSGNILDTNNIRGLWNRFRVDPRSAGVHLVTGDGSVDTSGDPNEQESIVSELHYTEAVCAMGALAKNGSLVLKMFNLFECETICLLYILALHFDQLSIFKPASSRAPNGETYVVALGFRGIDPEVISSLLSLVSPKFPEGKALLSLSLIPQSFLHEVIKIADYFTMKQVQALERNLELEKIWNRNIQQAIFQLNQDVVKEFRKRCSIDNNYKQRVRLVNHVWLDGSAKGLGNSAAVIKGGLRQRGGGTLQDRQKRKLGREEFLLKSNNNDGNDNDYKDDEEESERPTKKRALNQNKPVIYGRDISLKSGLSDANQEIDQDLSNNQQQEALGESLAMKMMKKSGYVEGQGLGTHGQGRATPVEVVMLNTRLGLGHHNQPNIVSTSSSDLPGVVDEPLFSSIDTPISSDSVLPPPKLLTKTIGGNLNSVLSSLFVKFDHLESLYKKREEYDKMLKDYKRNQSRIFISDQLETLTNDKQHSGERGIYVHYQAAFQLASLDKLFKLTSFNLNDSSPLLFIIDNASLTGFAEYLVWQQQNNVNGLLVSKLNVPFSMSSSVVVKSQIGPTHPKVHLLCSDVAVYQMNTPINRRYIEQYSKRELATSCRRALARLEKGGHFICKIFDTLTRFTAGLIYLLYRSFESICILRPFTLNPANPERFLVCRSLKYPVNETIIQHLDTIINGRIEDILEVVPIKCLVEPQFQQYMADTTQRLLQREIQALNKRLWYINHPNDQQIDSISQGEWNEARRCITISRRPKSTPIEPDSGITLPLGWTKEWSSKEQQHYYFNTQTGESRWEPPN